MDFIPDMLGRIVSNLVSNAFKYSTAGSTVTIRIRRILKKGKDHLELNVSDEGRGMTANQMENIFKPFYTASGGGETGTGIGLYVVKLSAEAMGGCADVSSVVGKGSDFRIVIPVSHDKAVETCVAPVCADDGYVPSAEGFEKMQLIMKVKKLLAFSLLKIDRRWPDGKCVSLIPATRSGLHQTVLKAFVWLKT
jgi:hypothetical protein